MLGFGTPVADEYLADSNSVSVGTHGQLWTLLVSNGYVATGLYLLFLVVVLVLCASLAAGQVVTYPHGRLRLGSRTLAGTIAHEVGHHLVNHTAGARTPGHGKVWVAAYDAAARRLATHPGLAGVLALSEPPLPTLAG